MKRNAIVRIVLFSILALALIAVLLGGIGFRMYGNHAIVLKKGSDAPVVQETSFSAQDIESLKISWLAGDIHLEACDTDKITVTESRDEDDKPMVLKKGDSQLIVEYSEDNNIISLNIPSSVKKDLYITVPRDWLCEELKIDAASADVMVTYLSIEEVDVDTASGKQSFQDCNVHSLEMDSASGDLDFTGFLDELKFSGASARANILTVNNPTSIKMDSLSGDLNLTLPLDCGFTIDQDSLSGSKNVEFDTREENGKLISGDGACSIKMSGLSASLRVSKGDSDSRSADR